MDEDIVQLVICLPDLAETVTKNELVRHITCEYSDMVASYAKSKSSEVNLSGRRSLLQQRK